MFEHMKAIRLEAIRYLALGWSVIPLAYREKHPAWSALPQVYDPAQKRKVGKWEEYQHRHARQDEVEYWFGRAACNVGIVCGKISGIVGIDCDSFSAYMWVRRNLMGYHDQTPIASSGAGHHVFFAYPGKPVANSVGTLGVDGLDIRGDGGYLVAAPSIHPSGRAYHWIIPPDTPLLNLPAWFFDPVQGCDPAPATATLSDLGNSAAGVYPTGKSWATARFETVCSNLRRAKVPAGNSDRGSRNDMLFKAAHAAGQIMGLKPMYQARVGTLDRATVERELHAIALGLGLTDREIKATLASGIKKGEAHAFFLEKYLDDHSQSDWWLKRQIAGSI
jgi:hypothetical protein